MRLREPSPPNERLPSSRYRRYDKIMVLNYRRYDYAY